MNFTELNAIRPDLGFIAHWIKPHAMLAAVMAPCSIICKAINTAAVMA